VIALLRGRIAETASDSVVLETGGVGYLVFCHLRTLAALHERRRDEVSLYVHTSVSDDAIRLYGFATRDELRFFQLLIGVERIGPKAALGILGRAEMNTMIRAIRGGDAKLVATVPGIGPKTAQRVVLELRDKLDGLALAGETPAPPVAEAEAVSAAVAGLVGLGFRESEARSAISAVAGDHEDSDVAALVGRALRKLDTAAAR